MKSLTEKPVSYIGQKKFWYHPKLGKVEDLYYLKPRGKKYLVNEHLRDPVDINLPLGSKLFWNDYHHRKETINIRIGIEQDAKAKWYTIDFYDMYFTGKSIPWKKGRECSTSIKVWDWKIKADSIFLLRKPDGTKSLFCLEYHNGTEVKRIVEQLKRYVRAMSDGTPSTKYGLEIWNYVLNVFAHETVKRSVEEAVDHDVYFRNALGTLIFLKKE